MSWHRNYVADSFSLPIITAITGTTRATGIATRKVIFRLVRLKTSPIIGGPMVIPSIIIVPCMDIKLARYSKGATPAAMTRWLGKFIPWATAKKIVGIRQDHRLGIKGVIAIARA